MRTRQYVAKFYTMRSQLQAVQLKLEVARTTEAMSSAMTGVSKALGAMNKQMNIPKLQEIMMDFERNNAKAEMQQEMMDDAMDEVMEGDEEEEDAIVSQVLDEIGITMGDSVPVAPSGLPEQAVAAPSATAAVPTAAAVAPQAAMAGGAAAAAPDPQVSELEARLNNLRR